MIPTRILRPPRSYVSAAVWLLCTDAGTCAPVTNPELSGVAGISAGPLDVGLCVVWYGCLVWQDTGWLMSRNTSAPCLLK